MDFNNLLNNIENLICGTKPDCYYVFTEKSIGDQNMNNIEERAIIYSVLAVFCAGLASISSPGAAAATLVQVIFVIETLYWFYNPLIRHVS